MTTVSYAVSDSATMLRRNLRHMLRYPSMTVMLVGLPVIFLLLFVYVFGGTLGAGLGGVSGGRGAYVNYVAPGIILLTVAAVAQGTAISVAMDMTEGIIARFRTMAVARSSVLTGHVVGATIQTLIGVVAVTAAAISHAAARLQYEGFLLVMDAVHQYAASVWVGGLMHLTAAAIGQRDRPWPPVLLQRFSSMALGSVAVLLAGGIGLTAIYVDGPYAVIGTGYGMMVLTKIAILGLLLGLGALNFFAVRRLPSAGPVSWLRLRRFIEVELGLGITVLFAAASLTSLPPAVDVVADRATPAEVGQVFTPRLPSFTSPGIDELPVDDRNAERTAEDRAWSEYNHHFAGLFVLAMGLLAVLHRTGWASWARHWPLVFFGLAAFLLVRNDPGAWPLGPLGFWESMQYPEVLQHRVFVLLVLGFGTFEWMVRTGRIRAPRAALIFPILCAVGGALLLTHSHASLNLKSEYLIEVTHAPLGIVAMLVGWGRWLELRLPPGEGKIPGRIWALCLTLVGVLLIFYREA